MSIFWALFWIAILIIPALWLASIVWTVFFYAIVFIIGMFLLAIEWVVKKVKEF